MPRRGTGARAAKRRNEDLSQAEPSSPAGQGRLPFGFHGAQGLRVGVDDADQDLAHEAATDRTQPLAGVQDLCLLEDVEPQRRLAGPTVLGEAELRGAQRWDIEAAGDRLAR